MAWLFFFWWEIVNKGVTISSIYIGIFWKTWCPCPPDLSTACRSECQQRSTAKVKVDEGNGRKKSSENGSDGGWPFWFDGQFGTPKSITFSMVSILSYLLFGTHRKLMNFGHRLEFLNPSSLQKTKRAWSNSPMFPFEVCETSWHWHLLLSLTLFPQLWCHVSILCDKMTSKSPQGFGLYCRVKWGF